MVIDLYQRFFSGMVRGLIMFSIAYGLFYMFFPVLGMMQAEVSADEKGYVYAEVSGYKFRDCLLVEDSLVGFYVRYGIPYETPFEPVDDSTPNSSKPASFIRKSFGAYLWSDVPDDAEMVQFTAQNNCWLDTIPRTTIVGPFLIKRPIATDAS